MRKKSGRKKKNIKKNEGMREKLKLFCLKMIKIYFKYTIHIFLNKLILLYRK